MCYLFFVYRVCLWVSFVGVWCLCDLLLVFLACLSLVSFCLSVCLSVVSVVPVVSEVTVFPNAGLSRSLLCLFKRRIWVLAVFAFLWRTLSY